MCFGAVLVLGSELFGFGVGAELCGLVVVLSAVGAGVCFVYLTAKIDVTTINVTTLIIDKNKCYNNKCYNIDY
jgi:hypothetical protein